MEREVLGALVEAILLTARGPVTSEAVVEAFAEDGVTAEEFNTMVEAIAVSWDRGDSGVRIERAAGGWRG